VVVAPEPTVPGAQDTELTTGAAVRESVAVWEVLLYVAVMIALPLVRMLPAVAVNVAVVAPAATVTLDGTPTTALLLESDTDAPPLGATCERVTVQLELPPPDTVPGLHDTELTTAGGISDTVVFFEPPLYVAVSVAL
jgi:hypothetical protein